MPTRALLLFVRNLGRLSAILRSRGAFYAAGVATPVVGIVLILVFCDMLAA